MAKKQPSKKSNAQKAPSTTNHVVIGLLLILVGLIALGGFFGAAGVGGFVISQGAFLLLGMGKYIIPIGFIAGGILAVRKRPLNATAREIITATVGLLALITLLSVYDDTWGGIVGRVLAAPLLGGFDTLFSSIILIFITATSFILFFDRTPNLFPFFNKVWEKITGAFGGKKDIYGETSYDDASEPEDEPTPQKIAAAVAEKMAPVAKAEPKEMTINDPSLGNELIIDPKKHNASFGTYTPPPLSLLEGDRGKANVGDVKANANIIRRTLSNFGIEVEMDEVTIGPTVTRYALKPAQGVKLSRIVGLQNDLALALAAHPIRIEAPIPGKSLVGIEIPNKTKATVGLANLLSDPLFSQDKKPLMVALGRNIAGKPVIKSIAKMPHLLIAGTTGSGKSVTIHAIIASLLYRHGPDDLRFIFVDPKRVELTLYNSIPHLLTPVITEPKKAILALKWAATEMSRRYDILEGESVRDIDSYHKLYEKELAKGASSNEEGVPDRMPYIVIIIDELADIMQAYPRELEAAIVRLAQMSRAVGIHLILSTQRPEVNIITGLIKANVPSRIALRVPTGIDSRTILDQTGAEKLLGGGDSLAMVGGDNQAERLQSAYITEDEVKNVVKYLKNAFKDDVRNTIELTGNVGGGNDKVMFGSDIGDDADDELYEEARTVVMEAGKASTSYIQRKLKVGYARAARLIDMLEERGVVGPGDGAKPREVLVGSMKDAVSDQVAEDMGL